MASSTFVISFTTLFLLFACCAREAGAAASKLKLTEIPFDENKVRHGKPLNSIDQYPFMCSIWKDDHKLCTSSIIAEQYILSAGHCFLDEPVANFTILCGTVDAKLEDGHGIQRKVAKSEVYSKEIFGKDIAIAKLDKPLNFRTNNTKAIKISNGRSQKSAFIAGWGRITDWTVPVTLQGANVSIWPAEDERCNGIMETEICAFGEGGENVCFGDSGGPLLIKNSAGEWEQVGITSRGNYVCELNGFFSRCCLYCPWISKVTEGEVQCTKCET